MEASFDHIVIVDNASNDGTDEYLRSIKDARLHIVILEKNLGGSGGFHEGLRYIRETIDTDWIVLYDDDAYPAQGTIDRFRQYEYSDDVGAVSAAVYLPDGSISEMNRVRVDPFATIGSAIRFFFDRSRLYLHDNAYTNTAPIDIASSTFVGLFIRKSILYKAGLPQKKLFIYGDDLMYTLSIKRKGYRILFDPRLRFVHDCQTFDQAKDVYQPLWKVYYSYRNRILVYKEMAPKLYLLFAALQYPSWRRKASYYREQKVFLQLLHLAISDALKQSFDKRPEDIESFIQSIQQR